MNNNIIKRLIKAQIKRLVKILTIIGIILKPNCIDNLTFLNLITTNMVNVKYFFNNICNSLKSKKIIKTIK